MLVIGIGNDYRGDDGAGLLVARQLRERVPSAVTVAEQGGEGARLLESWRDAEQVYIVDAVRSRARPGTIHRFDAGLHPLPAPLFRDSTHAFGLAEAVELGRAMNQLPASLTIYGIEGKRFERGAALSPEVLTASEELVKEILENIRRLFLPLEAEGGLQYN